jgi:hypothetical protein
LYGCAPEGRIYGVIDLVRVVLLVQGAILATAAVEAAVFSAVFGGASSPSALLTGVAALVVFIARARLVPARRRSRRALYAVEILILLFFGVDVILTLMIARTTVPPLAVVTQFAMPVAVLWLLGRVSRADAVPVAA